MKFLNVALSVAFAIPIALAATGSSIEVANRDVNLQFEVPEGGSRNEVLIAEFKSSSGKILKRLTLEGPKEAGNFSNANCILSKSKNLLVVTKKVQSLKMGNPHFARKNLDAEISWYGPDGTRLGAKRVFLTAAAAGVAPNGSGFVVIDAGFDPFDGDSQPEMSDESPEDQKIDLSYHQVFVLSQSGQELWSKRISDRTNYPPRVVGFSPSGNWLLLRLSDVEHLAIDIGTKSKKAFSIPYSGQQTILAHEIGDDGLVTAWKTEADTSRYVKRGSEHIYIPGKRTKRKYIMQLSDSDFSSTDVIIER